jgi:hypothetical protein
LIFSSKNFTQARKFTQKKTSMTHASIVVTQVGLSNRKKRSGLRNQELLTPNLSLLKASKGPWDVLNFETIYIQSKIMLRTQGVPFSYT